jgi:hypothetical protein
VHIARRSWKQEGLPEDVAVRLVHERQGLAKRRDNERSGDAVFQRQGRKVLVLDAKVSELFSEDVLDVDEVKLTPRRPKEDA